MLDCSLQKPFFFVLFVFVFIVFLGESCNGQRYFPTHARIDKYVSFGHVVLCSSLLEIKTVLNPQPS